MLQVYGIITYLYRTFMKKTARIELKVAPEFKERAEKAAKEQNRSLNNFIETVVEEKLDKIDEDKWLNS